MAACTTTASGERVNEPTSTLKKYSKKLLNNCAPKAANRQVIDNFLSNAIKYSPNGGDIEIGGHFTDNLVTVYIKDSGVGLPFEEQERVFERFYRVDGKLSRKTQGAGLGLFLSKAIIEAHGGTVGVDSKLGNGATFYFTLPY
jgi:signal transduction histidine kinase